MLLGDDGKFDFAKAQQNGAFYLLKRLKIRETTRTFRDGSVEQTIDHDATLRDRIGALHDMGLHLDLWNPEIDDPQGLLEQLLGFPKGSLPATLDDLDANAIEAEAVEVPNVSEQRSLTLAEKSTEVTSQMAVDVDQELSDGQRLEHQSAATYEPTPQGSKTAL